MTTAAHIISASYIALRVAGVTPKETDLIFVSLFSAGFLDLDHLYFIIKDRAYYKIHGYRGHLYKARSILHEMAGFIMVGICPLVLSFWNIKIAIVATLPVMIHQIEDIIMGISVPFNPIDKTEIHLLNQNMKIKTIIDILVVIVFGILWIQYLNAA